MIASIKGELAGMTTDTVLVENQGIAWEILVPLSVLERVGPVGSMVKLYTYLHVREDVLQLFGFLTKDDLEIFKLLITVNGIGPKGAIGILSFLTPDELRFAILAEDAKTIAKAPGIGAKTAGKMILELKDKLHLEDTVEKKLAHTEAAKGATLPNGIRKEAAEALMALGYASAESLRAVSSVEVTEDMTVEALLKLALKEMIR